MFQYFKKYTIAVCIIAVVPPLVVSTVWPFFTGQIMAASIGGLVLLFALFAAGLLIGFNIFSRKADAQVQEMLDEYNQQCDPEAFLEKGASIASQITYPCNQAAAWFMGYYAQALLDVGESVQAQDILHGIRLSIDAAKKPIEKAGILVNLVPLAEKVSGPQDALSLIEVGETYCSEAGGNAADQYRDYLESQRRLMTPLVSGDHAEAVQMFEKVRNSSQYPMRVRVEYAWQEAAELYKSADSAKERECLEFVAENGGKLALVSKARARLASL